MIFAYKIDKLYQGDKMLEKKNIFILLLLTALFYLLNIPSRVFEWFFLFFSLALILVYRMEKNMYFHKVLLFWCGGTLFALGWESLLQSGSFQNLQWKNCCLAYVWYLSWEWILFFC